METSQGIFGRLGEKVLGWIALALLIGIAYGIYQMPAETKAVVWKGIWTTLAWIAIAAAAPWSARLFMRRIMEVASNWAAAGLVGGFVLIDLIAGLILKDFPDGGWSWFFSLAALAVAGTYNYLVMEYLAAESRRVDTFQNPILAPEELEPAVRERLYWSVAAAVRRLVLAGFEADRLVIDDATEAVTAEALEAARAKAGERNPAEALIDDLATLRATLPRERRVSELTAVARKLRLRGAIEIS